MAGKQLGITESYVLTGGQDFIHPFQLCETKRGVQFTQAIVVTHPYMPQPGAIRIAPLISHAAAQFSDAGVIRRNHPAFTRRHLFVGIEREYACISKRASTLPVKFSADRFASIFDDEKPVL